MKEVSEMPLDLLYYWSVAGKKTINWWENPAACFSKQFDQYLMFFHLDIDGNAADIGSCLLLRDLDSVLSLLSGPDDLGLYCHYHFLHDFHDRNSDDPQARSYYCKFEELSKVAGMYDGIAPQYIVEENFKWCLVINYDGTDSMIACTHYNAKRLQKDDSIEFFELPLKPETLKQIYFGGQ